MAMLTEEQKKLLILIGKPDDGSLAHTFQGDVERSLVSWSGLDLSLAGASLSTT
jgi:hypothetical protein